MLIELRYRYHQAEFLLETLRGNPFPCLFRLLEATYLTWLLAFSSIFRVSTVESDPSHAAIFLDSSLPIPLPLT
jgi:hypothetical protein